MVKMKVYTWKKKKAKEKALLMLSFDCKMGLEDKAAYFAVLYYIQGQGYSADWTLSTHAQPLIYTFDVETMITFSPLPVKPPISVIWIELLV